MRLTAAVLLVTLGGCSWYERQAAQNAADDRQAAQERTDRLAAKQRAVSDKRRADAEEHAQKLERWCARRGQIFVGEKQGRIGHTIECRLPASVEERAHVQDLAARG